MSAAQTGDLIVDIGSDRTYPIRFVRNTNVVLTEIVKRHTESKTAIALVTDLNLQLAHPSLFEEVLENVPTFVISLESLLKVFIVLVRYGISLLA